MLRILLSVRLGEKRWTQKQLADATGIRRNTINDLYHEMTDRVSLEQLDLICKALDCMLRWCPAMPLAHPARATAVFPMLTAWNT